MADRVCVWYVVFFSSSNYAHERRGPPMADVVCVVCGFFSSSQSAHERRSFTLINVGPFLHFPKVVVYYCRTYEKAVSGGGEREKGGHVLRDTTSRGLYVQGC